jgi:hypothetical protein
MLVKEEGKIEARQKFKGLLISVTNSSLSVLFWALGVRSHASDEYLPT